MTTTSNPTAARRRLPTRRPSETQTLYVGNLTFAATVGFDPQDGRPREVFLAGAKDGTDMAAILDDASVVMSVALQHGVSAAALAKSVARLPSTALVPSDLAAPTGPSHTAPISMARRTISSCRRVTRVWYLRARRKPAPALAVGRRRGPECGWLAVTESAHPPVPKPVPVRVGSRQQRRPPVPRLRQQPSRRSAELSACDPDGAAVGLEPGSIQGLV